MANKMGNPNFVKGHPPFSPGRPPGQMNLSALIKREGGKYVEVGKDEEGNPIRKTNMQLMVENLWGKARKDEKWAIELLSKYLFAQKDSEEKGKKKIGTIEKRKGSNSTTLSGD